MTNTNTSNDKDLLDVQNQDDWRNLNRIIQTYSPESIAECISYATSEHKIKAVHITNELNLFNAGLKQIR